MLLALLSACFTPMAEPLALETVAFANAYTNFPDGVLQPFAYEGLDCPDGEPATFFAVYRQGLTDPAPLVVVFHAGAFDYALPAADGTVPALDVAGTVHYREDDRLRAEWASTKVFETLGLLANSIDTTEDNLGTLPAALLDAGAVALYPANCWGDLWHNEAVSAPNDAREGFTRNGRFLAWAMTAIASADTEVADRYLAATGLDALPVEIDRSGVFLVGLGEGGRALPELVLRAPAGLEEAPAAVRGMIVDSTMDDLYPLVANSTAFPDYVDGLARLYPDPSDVPDADADGLVYGDVCNGAPPEAGCAEGYRDDVEADIGRYSLARAFAAAPPAVPLGVWWSSADPLLPDETIAGLVAVAEAAELGHVVDTTLSAHIVLNADPAEARKAVGVLLGK